MDEIMLKNIEDLDPMDQTAVNAYLQQKVSDMIELAREQWIERNGNADFPKPLIRLKIEYSGGFTTFNPQRFGQHFVDTVANPKEILHFYRQRTASIRTKKNENDMDINPYIPEKLDDFHVEDLVSEFLSAQKLQLLPENELQQTVKQFVNKHETGSISTFLSETLDRTQIAIDDVDVEDNEVIEGEVGKFKDERCKEFALSIAADEQDIHIIPRARDMLSKTSKTVRNKQSRVNSDEKDEDEEENVFFIKSRMMLASMIHSILYSIARSQRGY